MSRRLAWTITLGLLVAAGAGCGTRVHESAEATAFGGPAGPTSGTGFAGTDATYATGATETGQATGAVTPQPTGAGTGRAIQGSAPSAGGSGTGAPSSARPSSDQAAGGGAASGVDAEAGTSSGAPAAPTAPGAGSAAVTPGTKSPILLGNIGTYSGPASGAAKPYLTGIQIWQKWVNSRGGVNGHKVELIVADDGADPARHRAAMQELIERRNVLAFINNVEPFSGNGHLAYLNSKRIPVIGISGSEKFAYDSPMYFPQAASGQQLTNSFFASWAQQALAQGKKKFALVSCTEAELCRDFYEQAPEQTAKRGLELVYRGRISLAQPDFTAECLAARNAGAEIFFLGGDGGVIRRGASSCIRQGYKPLFATGSQIATADMEKEPNLEGLISNATAFPYFQDTPATAEYQAAVKAFGGANQPALAWSMSWVSGKLFERAAASIAEPPTTAAILAGLWSLKGEDLGGLAQPLTFTKDQLPTRLTCWWNVAVKSGKWSSPDNFARSCD